MTSTAPQPRLKKILMLITEDWFALSHFQPLITTLKEVADEVVVGTRSSGRTDEIEALGALVREFDFRRSSLNPFEQAKTVRRLSNLIAEEAPDAIHVVAMQPMVLTALATLIAPRTKVVMHLTGLGFLGISRGRAARIIRPAAMSALGGVLKRDDTWLIAENPDDHGYLAEGGVNVGDRLTILPGAGIDAEQFPPCPVRENGPVTAAFVGRMIRSKGVEVLTEAGRLLKALDIDVGISLYGKADVDNPEAISEARLHEWQDEGLATWHGHVADIAQVWQGGDICVLPSTSREGMPRAVLEAAASARPLIVTDVPGSRHFVRDGIEGFVVPPDDAAALAEAIGRLVKDTSLRAQMGEAARARLVGGFTIDHVRQGIREAYAGLAASSR
ncbi:MAG: glycosyltransferase family 4 protein [Alphaproteobacteria bacterium]|nr:glycosyltransferase family 4 protein [Alphaproteobacteria bacterium]